MKRTVLTRGVAVVGACCALAGCGAGQVTQTQQEVPDTPGIDASVGAMVLDDVYLLTATAVPEGGSVPLRAALSNDSIRADRLVRITSPDAASVQVLGPDGRPSTDGLVVPAEGSVDVTTGPVRLRLTGLTKPLAAMGSITVTFAFATAGSVTVDVPAATPTT